MAQTTRQHGSPEATVRAAAGDKFTFTIEEGANGTNNRISVNYDGFIDDVSVGDILLVDGGLQSLMIIGKDGKDVHTEVVDGGTMKSRCVPVPLSHRAVPPSATSDHQISWCIPDILYLKPACVCKVSTSLRSTLHMATSCFKPVACTPCCAMSTRTCAFRQITLVSQPYTRSSLLAREMPWPMGELQQVRTSRQLCPAGVT